MQENLWRPVLVKIMTIKLHHKSILIQLQQILWTCCVFLSSLNNTFFSVLVIIFSNKSYFCFNCTNTFFIHAMNYFSMILRIILLVCMKNYFLIGPRIIFSRYREFIFWSKMHCGPCIWSGLVRIFDFLGRPFWKLCKWRSAFKGNAKAKHCQGKKRKRFSSFLQNLSGASSLCLRDEVFWTEVTSLLLHNSNPYWTWHVRPIGLFSTHTCWVSNEDAENESVPYPEVK